MHLIKSISGVRGIVTAGGGLQVTLTPQVATDLGRAFATYLARTGRPQHNGLRWIIGARDGRPSGLGLLRAFSEGAWECGARVVPLGVAATPTAGFAVAEFAASLGVCGGVIITASHNPEQWNGVKLLLDGGRAPSPVDAARIYDLLDRRDFDRVRHDHPPAGASAPDATELHVERVLEQIDPTAVRHRAFCVVLDSINGAGCRAGRMLLDRLGCRVTHLNNNPDTSFGRDPEPTRDNLTGLCEAVVRHEADVGFAQDPDADRLAIVDAQGRYIGEEYTLALAAKYVFATCPGPAVANLSTSRLIDAVAAAAGPPCVVHRSAVGETNVVDLMQKVGAHIGGEGNGGVIDPRVVYIRDSITAMALTLQLMAEEERPLSQIVNHLPSYTIVKRKVQSTPERAARVVQAVREEFADQRINDLDGVRVDWPEGWVHVRGSNTEPILRIIAEAADEQTANELIARAQAVADRFT